MTHALPIDPYALAARLRLWALGLVVQLIELLGAGPLTRMLKRWATAELNAGERGAKALVVLAALRRTPAAPPALHRTLRPLGAARGFRRRWRRTPRIAVFARGLFPRERDLLVRARRLAAVLADLDAAGAPVLRLLLRLPAFTGIVAIAPPAAPCVPRVDALAPPSRDTS